MQMVGELGGVEAAKSLLRSREPSEGFTKLWETNRLHLSVEFHVLLPEYEALFTQEEREVAQSRLEAHEFDIDRSLRNRLRVRRLGARYT